MVWKVFLKLLYDREVATHSKQDHYFAFLGMQVEKLYRSNVGIKTPVTLEEMLLKFEPRSGEMDEDGLVEQEEVELTQEGMERYAERSESIWMGFANALGRMKEQRRNLMSRDRKNVHA